MFRRAKRVMVALSGGPDSLACLLLLRALGEREGFEVIAGHFDHKLRPDSGADLERVRVLCTELAIECMTGEGDVALVAKEQRMGIEETARRMRYQFLSFVADKEHADCLATGHTADDQAETVLMRVVRGAGIRGLRGMAPVSGIPGAPAQRLVRPLLGLGRSETRAICDEAGIEPIEDPSNSDMRYVRNRIRLETLPALRSINPSVDKALRSVAASARQVFEGVERQALETRPRVRGPVGTIFELGDIRKLPVEALTLVIVREASFAKADAGIGRVRLENAQDVLKRGSGRVVFGDCVFEVSCGQVRIGPQLEDADVFPPKVLDIPGSTVCGPWRVDVATSPLPEMEGALRLSIDREATRGLLRLRPVAAGDRIHYHGHQRRVSDLFVNEKIPVWERAGALALTDADGVVALAGAFGVRTDAAHGDDVLHVRISAVTPPAPAGRIELPGGWEQ